MFRRHRARVLTEFLARARYAHGEPEISNRYVLYIYKTLARQCASNYEVVTVFKLSFTEISARVKFRFRLRVHRV